MVMIYSPWLRWMATVELAPFELIRYGRLVHAHLACRSDHCLSQPHPNTGAWVYYKHKGWCYRAFNAKRVLDERTGPVASGVYAAPEATPLQTTYSLRHSAGWRSNITASDDAGASTSHSRRSNLARLRSVSGAKQAVLAAPVPAAAAAAAAGQTHATHSPRMASLQSQYCAQQGIAPAGKGRPKGRLPAALRAQGHSSQR